MSAPVKIYSYLIRFVFLAIMLIAGWAHAQVLSRSGAPAPLESHWVKRPFPCDSRQIIFEENFSGSNLPIGWTAQARDTADLNLAIDTIYQDNWQPIVDFKDASNGAVASPSWHTFEDRNVPTDNWLISPEVTLGSNTCFSWVAYSQDRFYPESYQVLLSPTGGVALEDFTDTLAVVDNEAFLLLYRSADLGDYAGQTVRVAFRHTSVQSFMLVLDDIRFAEVAQQDVGVVGLVRPSGDNSFDSTRVFVTIRNYGSDSLNLDSLRLAFRDQNQTIPADTVVVLNTNKQMLAPNDTTTISHPRLWNPDADTGAYDLWVWTELANDPYTDNDTLYRRVGVGLSVTSIDPQAVEEFAEIFPNPTRQDLTFRGDAPSKGVCRVLDMQGRFVIRPVGIQKGPFETRLNLGHLAPGLYFLQFRGENGEVFNRKFLKQ